MSKISSDNKLHDHVAASFPPTSPRPVLFKAVAEPGCVLVPDSLSLCAFPVCVCACGGWGWATLVGGYVV